MFSLIFSFRHRVSRFIAYLKLKLSQFIPSILLFVSLCLSLFQIYSPERYHLNSADGTGVQDPSGGGQCNSQYSWVKPNTETLNADNCAFTADSGSTGGGGLLEFTSTMNVMLVLTFIKSRLQSLFAKIARSRGVTCLILLYITILFIQYYISLPIAILAVCIPLIIMNLPPSYWTSLQQRGWGIYSSFPFMLCLVCLDLIYDHNYLYLADYLLSQSDSYSSPCVPSTRYELPSFVWTILTSVGVLVTHSLISHKFDLSIKLKNSERMIELNKTNFLASLTHDLRTPLHGLLSSCKLLYNDPQLSESQRESVELIEDNGRSLLAMLNTLLDLSSIGTERMKLYYSNRDLWSICEKCVDSLLPLASNLSLDLYALILDGVPRFAKLDSYRLEQILMNLLANAIKFTKKGKIELKVELIETIKEQNEGQEKGKEAAADATAQISATPAPAPAKASSSSHPARFKLRFTVTDSGCGISPADQEKLFKKFSQGSQTGFNSSNSTGGVGLGLYLCKQLVELMGGKIWVDSSIGTGAKFAFEIVLEEGINLHGTPLYLKDRNSNALAASAGSAICNSAAEGAEMEHGTVEEIATEEAVPIHAPLGVKSPSRRLEQTLSHQSHKQTTSCDSSDCSDTEPQPAADKSGNSPSPASSTDSLDSTGSSESPTLPASLPPLVLETQSSRSNSSTSSTGQSAPQLSSPPAFSSHARSGQPSSGSSSSALFSPPASITVPPSIFYKFHSDSHPEIQSSALVDEYLPSRSISAAPSAQHPEDSPQFFGRQIRQESMRSMSKLSQPVDQHSSPALSAALAAEAELLSHHRHVSTQQRRHLPLLALSVLALCRPAAYTVLQEYTKSFHVQIEKLQIQNEKKESNGEGQQENGQKKADRAVVPSLAEALEVAKQKRWNVLFTDLEHLVLAESLLIELEEHYHTIDIEVLGAHAIRSATRNADKSSFASAANAASLRLGALESIHSASPAALPRSHLILLVALPVEFKRRPIPIDSHSEFLFTHGSRLVTVNFPLQKAQFQMKLKRILDNNAEFVRSQTHLHRSGLSHSDTPVESHSPPATVRSKGSGSSSTIGTGGTSPLTMQNQRHGALAHPALARIANSAHGSPALMNKSLTPPLTSSAPHALSGHVSPSMAGTTEPRLTPLQVLQNSPSVYFHTLLTARQPRSNSDNSDASSVSPVSDSISGGEPSLPPTTFSVPSDIPPGFIRESSEEAIIKENLELRNKKLMQQAVEQAQQHETLNPALSENLAQQETNHSEATSMPLEPAEASVKPLVCVTPADFRVSSDLLASKSPDSSSSASPSSQSSYSPYPGENSIAASPISPSPTPSTASIFGSSSSLNVLLPPNSAPSSRDQSESHDRIPIIPIASGLSAHYHSPSPSPSSSTLAPVSESSPSPAPSFSSITASVPVPSSAPALAQLAPLPEILTESQQTDSVSQLRSVFNSAENELKSPSSMRQSPATAKLPSRRLTPMSSASAVSTTPPVSSRTLSGGSETPSSGSARRSARAIDPRAAALYVMVVDDQLINTKLAANMLKMIGIASERFLSAAEGMERLKKADMPPFTHILTDIHMPETSGCEFARLVRALPAEALPKQPIIIGFTASPLPELKATCLASGMEFFLAKPCEIEELKEIFLENRDPRPDN